MGKSLQLGSVAGIRIQVHWTFVLIIAWVLLTSFASGSSALSAFSSVAFVLVLFGCVLLHELGHALAAKWYGIPTRDITLLPIGGVARLERMPRKPSQELVVALAGPAVNVVIAVLLLALLLPTAGLPTLADLSTRGANFLQQLMVVNLALVVFNMLPAFPLDGGRVLRALLAMVMGYGRATRVAAGIGQVSAGGLALLGLVNPFLLLIAAFVFIGAATEARQVSMREKFRGYRVDDGMIKSFRAVPADVRIRDLAERLLDGPQRDYPVIDEGTFVGMLNRDDLLTAVESDGDTAAGDIMDTDIRPVEAQQSLMDVLEQSASTTGKTLAVIDEGELVGLFDPQQVLEIAEARARLRARFKHVEATIVREASPNFA